MSVPVAKTTVYEYDDGEIVTVVEGESSLFATNAKPNGYWVCKDNTYSWQPNPPKDI